MTTLHITNMLREREERRKRSERRERDQRGRETTGEEIRRPSAGGFLTSLVSEFLRGARNSDFNKQVHISKKACVAVYSSVVQNDIVWFWPNTDPQYSDILSKKRPPYIPELDDPSFTRSMSNRDIPYGYDVLIDNLMDLAHVNYAHYGIMIVPKRKESMEADREGGQAIEINVEKLDVDGYKSNQGYLKTKFMAPCVFYAFPPPAVDPSNGSVSSAGTKEDHQKLHSGSFC